MKAVLGNSLVPWYMIAILARFGYDAQQTDEPVSHDRPDNLFTPASRDYGAHGRFDEGARSSSIEWWMTKHRGAALACVSAIGATAALATVRRYART